MKLKDLQITDYKIKIGRQETMVFVGDCIRDLPDINTTIFIGSKLRNVVSENKEVKQEWMDIYNDGLRNGKITYSFTVSNNKVSKKLFNDWKKLPNVRSEETTAPNGNRVINYFYE